MKKMLLWAWIGSLGSFGSTALSKEDKAGIDAWFTRYDELTKKGDVAAMADLAKFPVHVVTTDGGGEGYAEDWSRETFIAVMTDAMKGTPKDLEMKAKRRPFFLNDDLVVVITDATIVTGKQTSKMRYADVLVKEAGKWKFQTMAQAGWGDLLKSRAKAPATK